MWRFRPAVIAFLKVKLSEASPHDFNWTRERMVREQIIARGITDARVINTLRKIPRHYSSIRESSIAPTMTARCQWRKADFIQPYMAARMTEALGLSGDEKVLEIGAGSGYQTALLAELCFNVFSVERIRALSRKARTLLDQLGYQNIALHVGDGTIGWSEHAPYDAILVSAGSPATPKPLLEQLGLRGRLVIPVGDEQTQSLVRVTRTRSGFKQEPLGECKFVKLFGKYGWRD